MTFPTNLRHFTSSEFGGYADMMDKHLLFWLDDIRERLGIPLIVTSSGRSPSSNVVANGYADSLHLVRGDRVRAVDVQTEAMRDRVNHRIPADNFIVNRAACWDVRPYGRRVEVICESRANVWHFHFGMFDEGDARPSRFTIIRKDAQ